MGKDYHITRASDWTATEGQAITSSEWQQYAHNDPELNSDPENGPCSFVWDPEAMGSGDAWLDWAAGNVYTTDPKAPLLEKMQRIAVSLGARVVDDDNNEAVVAQSAPPREAE